MREIRTQHRLSQNKRSRRAAKRQQSGFYLRRRSKRKEREEQRCKEALFAIFAFKSFLLFILFLATL
jgi:hypothetical protein